MVRVRWTAVNSTYGVARLVSFRPHEPAEVPLSLVASLMQRCDAFGRVRPPAILRPRDQVKIVAGPFSDFVATVETLAPERRVWVMLELMDRMTRVAVAGRICGSREGLNADVNLGKRHRRVVPREAADRERSRHLPGDRGQMLVVVCKAFPGVGYTASKRELETTAHLA